MTIAARIKIAAVILFVMAAAGHVFYTLSLKHELAEKDGCLALAQTELATARQDAAAKSIELDLNRRALADSEAVTRRLTLEAAALRDRLNEVYANDENAQSWRDALCPDGVRDCLLN